MSKFFLGEEMYVVPDAIGSYIGRLQESHNRLLDAATESLALLQKGAPGWSVAKDLLGMAIAKTAEFEK